MLATLFAAVPLTAMLLAEGAPRLWYAAPLIVSISLAYAATRHEETRAILAHALRFGMWVVVFMLVLAGGLQAMAWMQ